MTNFTRNNNVERHTKDNRLYGDFIVGHIVPKDRSIDIDYPLDWIQAEYMLEQLKKKGEIE
jgi:CMP-N-acetylneuraminic acid synthetase